jgi:SAM-dependent methyltransferase
LIDAVSKICQACGTVAPQAFRALDTNRHIGSESFAYFRCPKCGWLFLEPIPSNLGAYYPQDYHTIPRSREELADLAVPEKYKLSIVLNHCQSGRLLEIGPSNGMFLSLAEQAGFHAEAIEMNPDCCRFLRSLGFTVYQSDDPASTLSSFGPFDVIALWHVFEHLPRPWAVLPILAKSLVGNGILVLAVPNPQSLQFRIFGKRWTHLDAPRHLHLTPISLLAKRAAECGLTLISCSYNDPGSLGWNRFGWVHSLRNLATWQPLRVALHVIARGAELMALPWERTGNRGCAYTAVFRKAS